MEKVRDFKDLSPEEQLSILRQHPDFKTVPKETSKKAQQVHETLMSLVRMLPENKEDDLSIVNMIRDAAQGLAGHLYSVTKALNGDPITPEEVMKNSMDFSPSQAAAGIVTGVPKNSVGMFAGTLETSFKNSSSKVKFELMKNKYRSIMRKENNPMKAWEESKLHEDYFGNLLYEISLSPSSKWNPKVLRNAMQGESVLLSDLMPTNSGLNEYHGIGKMMRLRTWSDVNSADAAGYFDKYKNLVVVNGKIHPIDPDNPDFRNTFAHEIQHAIQSVDSGRGVKRGLGYNPKQAQDWIDILDANSIYLEGIKKNEIPEEYLGEIMKLSKISQIINKYPYTPEVQKWIKDEEKLGPLNNISKNYYTKLKTYTYDVGETEARNAGQRAEVPALQRQHPEATQDLPTERLVDFARSVPSRTRKAVENTLEQTGRDPWLDSELTP